MTDDESNLNDQMTPAEVGDEGERVELGYQPVLEYKGLEDARGVAIGGLGSLGAFATVVGLGGVLLVVGVGGGRRGGTEVVAFGVFVGFFVVGLVKIFCSFLIAGGSRAAAWGRW
jgi:hypothetical protein